MMKLSLGVDVSKDTLAVCLMHSRQQDCPRVLGTRTFQNTAKGLEHLFAWVAHKRGKAAVEALPCGVVLEATGVYHERLAYYVDRHDALTAHVLLPTRLKGYRGEQGGRNKTDRQDAKLLAQMGLEKHLSVWSAPSATLRQLRKRSRQREQFLEQRTRLKNQLHAERSSQHPDQEVISHQKQSIAFLNQRIQALEVSMKRLVEGDDALHRGVEHMCTIKGVGIMTALVVVAETYGFEEFTSRSQLVSYAGYDVRQYQSGSSVHRKGRMSKRGNAHIRRALHFPALCVVKHHEEFARHYARVYDRSGVKMKGYVAIQSRLLRLMYTLFKNKEDYIEGYAEQTKATQTQSVDQKLDIAMIN